LTRDLEFNSLRRTLSPQELPGTFITLLSRHSGSFYHWFTECLLRLSLLESTPSSTPILVHHDLRDWQRDTLRLLGISDDRIMPLANGCYEVDQLYFPSFLAYASFTQDWTFSWADWSLRWLRAQFCGTRTATPEKRIYISRQGAAHRQVLNEDQVIRRLQGDGFQIVDANPLSLREKIELFGDASIILSAHGAGLTHILFAPAGARVIEALDPYHLMGGLYYQMAASLRQEYWYLFAENQAWQSRRPSREPNQQWPFKGAVNPQTGARKGYDNLTIPVDLMMRTVDAAQEGAANT
jgi:capsular polysaccharide biosynthesis protein